MEARKLIETVAREAIKPRVFDPVWKWAENNVNLSVRTTNAFGRYDSSWVIYTRMWQDVFTNPRIKEIVICSGGQTGKTESLLNCLRFAIAEDPGPMLWIFPAESLARSVSETRMQPSFKDCPPCAAQIPDDADAFKLLEMHFKHCTLNLVGANSPAQLSSRPIRYLFADEIDKFPDSSTKEAGALELARVRTTTFWNAKTILTSTPTVESGQIWQAFMRGTRHKFFVHCPHCAFGQELFFPQVKWPKDQSTKPDGKNWDTAAVEKLAWYECSNCRRAIEQKDRAGMVRAGEWRQTNPLAPADRVSFHLSALYSPWRSWGSIAREFLEVKDSPSGLQNFTNAVLAEPWKTRGELIEEQRLLDLRSEYALGTCPVKPRALTLAADVQRDCVYFTVNAWGENKERWLVDYGKVPTLETLNEVMVREYNVAGSEETVKPGKGMIDSGYNTEAVYELCWRSRGRLHPCKGWESLKQPVTPAIINVAGGRLRGAFSVKLFHFDDSAFKHELYIRQIQDREGPKAHLPHNIGSDYIQQLTAETLVEKKNQRGIPEAKWHRLRPDNHYGDCEKIQLVQGHLLTPDLRPKPEKLEEAEQKPEPKAKADFVRAPLLRPTRMGGGFVQGWRK